MDNTVQVEPIEVWHRDIDGDLQLITGDQGYATKLFKSISNTGLPANLSCEDGVYRVHLLLDTLPAFSPESVADPFPDSPLVTDEQILGVRQPLTLRDLCPPFEESMAARFNAYIASRDIREAYPFGEVVGFDSPFAAVYIPDDEVQAMGGYNNALQTRRLVDESEAGYVAMQQDLPPWFSYGGLGSAGQMSEYLRQAAQSAAEAEEIELRRRALGLGEPTLFGRDRVAQYYREQGSDVPGLNFSGSEPFRMGYAGAVEAPIFPPETTCVWGIPGCKCWQGSQRSEDPMDYRTWASAVPPPPTPPKITATAAGEYDPMAQLWELVQQAVTQLFEKIQELWAAIVQAIVDGLEAVADFLTAVHNELTASDRPGALATKEEWIQYAASQGRIPIQENVLCDDYGLCPNIGCDICFRDMTLSERLDYLGLGGGLTISITILIIVVVI